MPTDAIHLFLDIVTPLILAILAYVTVMNKTERAESALKLLKGITDLKEDFNAKHAENTQAIAVHQVEDLQKFDAIGKSLVRIDSKLDRIANRRGTGD